MKPIARVVVLCLALTIAAGSRGAARSEGRYLPPVLEGGMSFPLARTDWYSVINFSDDWHQPRMRLTGGVWEQTGFHEGTDIYAEPGTPVRAVLGGTVEQIGWTFYSGWRVGIRGTDGRYWFYAHLSTFAPGIGVGSTVESGDELGAVGNTGYGFEPGHSGEFIYHLHIGVQEPSGVWVDPYPIVKRLYRAAVDRPQ